MASLKSVAGSAAMAFGIVLLAYNILMMMNSPEGVLAKAALQEQIEIRKQNIVQLEERHAFLSRRADALLTAQLDEDLLEERVRGVLGLVRPDEYIVRMEDLDRLAERNSDDMATVHLAEADIDADEDDGEVRLRYAALPIELLQ